MSETVTHIGKLRKVDLGKNSIELFAESYLMERGKTVIPSYCSNWTEFLLESYYNEFIMVDKILYEIIEDKKSSYEDICFLIDNGDGTFDYVMQFYNGGTCLSEMIEDGFENLNKDE